MSKPIHVVFLIAAFFPKPTGATYSATRLARELTKRGVRIHVFTSTENGWPDGEDWEGLPVSTFDAWGSGKWKKIKAMVRMVRMLRSKQVPCDIFHIHGGGHMNLIISSVIKLFCRVRVMMKMTLDGWDTPDGVITYPWGKLNATFFRRLDAVVAMTSGQKEKCHQFGYPGLVDVIPNGVDVRKYAPLSASERLDRRRELGIAPDDIVLVYVGWLGKRKGTDVLVNCFLQLQEKYRQLMLMLVGDYIDNRKAGDLLKPLGIQNGMSQKVFAGSRVICTGPVDNAEAFLQAADVFTFPSRQEGFGTVQIEAMACGLPCVVNELPGVSGDIYPDESVGYRISGNDTDAWINILDALIEDPSLRLRMGAKARQRVMDHFSLESVGERYLTFYDQLTEK
jgi:glycosyltransferase involved in cell wall biosynthesis